MHNLVYGKLDFNGNFIVIPLAAYAAGPISNEWAILDLDDILENSKFCRHGKEDFFNHIPIFIQDNTIFCSKCYEKLEDKMGECLVLLENNRVRQLYPFTYEYSNVIFNLSCNIFDEDSFKLNVSIKNLKRSKLHDLKITIFSFENSLDLNDDDIGWMFENPINAANLIIFKEYGLGDINPYDTLENEAVVRIPNKNEIKTFDLAFKNNLLDEDNLKLNEYFGIDEIKTLYADFPLNIYIIVFFKNNYGVYQYHEEKLVLMNDR